MSVPHGHHYGLTEEDMAVVLEEVDKRLAIRSYVEVAAAIGRPLGGTRKLMQEIMRERRAGIIRDHRGTRRKREFHVEQNTID